MTLSCLGKNLYTARSPGRHVAIENSKIKDRYVFQQQFITITVSEDAEVCHTGKSHWKLCNPI